jgi:LacI family transcriptional regulator
MVNKRVTSQDVANLAGVSRTTVSFVLNNNSRFAIREDTAERVRAAARELGYYPNASARALASNQTKTIGLIIPRAAQYISTDPFLPQILGGLLEVLKVNKQGLLIEAVCHDQQLETYLELTRAHHIDGIIVMTPRSDDDGIRALVEADIPVVLMASIPGVSLHSVDIDNTRAAEMATRHLVELGHRKIAMITNAPLPYTSASQRLAGYQNALKAAGIDYDESLVREADFDTHSGYLMMKSLLEDGKDFTAVFIASDNVAYGAYSAIEEAGLSIPQDISVVGFDDIPQSAYTKPALTTIRIPARDIARESYHLLMRLMHYDYPEGKVISLPTELILRKSTRSLNGD